MGSTSIQLVTEWFISNTSVKKYSSSSSIFITSITIFLSTGGVQYLSKKVTQSISS